jgi:hypothetical protein
LLTALLGQGAGSDNTGATKAGGRVWAEQVVRGPLMNASEVGSFFARDAGNLLGFIARSDLPGFALYRCIYHSAEDDALFGGLFDPAPGQNKPVTTRAQREARDKSKLWHVPFS